MNTRMLLAHEPVADGGFLARATLVIEGRSGGKGRGWRPPSSAEPGPPTASLSASNVHVSVSPGRDAEFIQVTHPFESRGTGRLLMIAVGDIYDVDHVRIRMEALVGPRPDGESEADVGRIVVFAQIHTEDGGIELRAVTLPIRLSPVHGGRVHAHVRTIPCSFDRSSPHAPTIQLPLVDAQGAV